MGRGWLDCATSWPVWLRDHIGQLVGKYGDEERDKRMPVAARVWW